MFEIGSKSARRSVPLAACVVPLALVLCAAACAEPEAESVMLAPRDRNCVEGDVPSVFFSDSALFSDANFYPCALDEDGDGPLVVTRVESRGAVVTGIESELLIHWEGGDSLQGHKLFYTFSYAAAESDPMGYYVFEPADENPIRLPLKFLPRAPTGDFTFSAALGDGVSPPEDSRVGKILSTDLYVIQVGTGDIQVNLHWDRLVDLDLHVSTAGRGVTYWNNPDNTDSGGLLDLDSYPGCWFADDPGRGNENVFWPEGGAPSGDYVVTVYMYSACDLTLSSVSIPFFVTLVHNTDVRTVETYEGSFNSSFDVDPEFVGDTPEGKGATALRFSYP